MFPVTPKDLCRITLPFGYKYPNCEPYISWGVAGVTHLGIDIGRKDRSGKTQYYITAPVAGRILEVGTFLPPPIGTDAYTQYVQEHKLGRYIILESSDSDKGFKHYLCHMYKIQVPVGKVVSKGAVLGIMGTTGLSSGVHLHYGIHDLDGKRIDPGPYLT